MCDSAACVQFTSTMERALVLRGCRYKVCTQGTVWALHRAPRSQGKALVVHGGDLAFPWVPITHERARLCTTLRRSFTGMGHRESMALHQGASLLVYPACAPCSIHQLQAPVQVLPWCKSGGQCMAATPYLMV